MPRRTRGSHEPDEPASGTQITVDKEALLRAIADEVADHFELTELATMARLDGPRIAARALHSALGAHQSASLQDP